jgi:hypothetical protein
MALVCSACGSSDDDVTTTDPGGDGPAAAGLCVEGVVDCDDTGVIDGSSGSERPGVGTGGGAVISGAASLESGLTIEEALVSDVGEILAVRGNLFDDGSGLRLCSALAESFPPQCGGASMPVEGFGFDRISGLSDDELVRVEQSGGVSWTDGPVTLFGEVVDGTLVVDELAVG